MAYPPTGSVQTECTRLPVMLLTKGRFLCQRTIGFVGLQKHINSGYAFAERQIAHNLSLIHIYGYEVVAVISENARPEGMTFPMKFAFVGMAEIGRAHV